MAADGSWRLDQPGNIDLTGGSEDAAAASKRRLTASAVAPPTPKFVKAGTAEQEEERSYSQEEQDAGMMPMSFDGTEINTGGSSGDKGKGNEDEKAKGKGKHKGKSDKSDKNKKGGKNKDKGNEGEDNRSSGTGTGGDSKYQLKNPANKKPMELMMKAVLSLMQRMRDLEAVVLTTHICKTDASPILELKGELKLYDGKCKEAGKQHSYGPPYPHLYLVLLETLGALSTTKEEHKRTLMAEHSELKAKHFSEIDKKVKLIRVLKTYRSETKRLLIATTHENKATEAIMCSLAAGGAEQKIGRAPRGALEMELQNWLEETFLS